MLMLFLVSLGVSVMRLLARYAITQKVLSRFSRYFQEILIMGQGTDDCFLVTQVS